MYAVATIVTQQPAPGLRPPAIAALVDSLAVDAGQPPCAVPDSMRYAPRGYVFCFSDSLAGSLSLILERGRFLQVHRQFAAPDSAAARAIAVRLAGRLRSWGAEPTGNVTAQGGEPPATWRTNGYGIAMTPFGFRRDRSRPAHWSVLLQANPLPLPYAMTSSPLDVGAGTPLCIAVRGTGDSAWWWEAGRLGCEDRSTGPGIFPVFQPEITRVTARRGGLRLKFRLQLHAPASGRADSFTDVVVVFSADTARAEATGETMPLLFRENLEIPGPNK